ncbi:MAG: MBL fold metallo-hydrolase [Verrucomicrobiota bacterium]
MELIFLGTGTSQGVPMIAYDQHLCDLEDKRNWRTRTSAHVVMDGVHHQIDAGPEFRMQCLGNQIDWVDYFFLTHGHSDHIMGMDDLRRFCDMRENNAVPVYSSEEGLKRVREVFPYAARESPAYKGYPAFHLNPMPEVLECKGGRVESGYLTHGHFQVLGLVFIETSTGSKLAYYTDCKELSERAWKIAQDVDVLVIDGLRHEPHPTHLCLNEAIEVARELKAKRTFFTHMTHHVDHAKTEADLPESMKLAFDGLRIKI